MRSVIFTRLRSATQDNAYDCSVHARDRDWHLERLCSVTVKSYAWMYIAALRAGVGAGLQCAMKELRLRIVPKRRLINLQKEKSKNV